MKKRLLRPSAGEVRFPSMVDVRCGYEKGQSNRRVEKVEVNAPKPNHSGVKKTSFDLLQPPRKETAMTQLRKVNSSVRGACERRRMSCLDQPAEEEGSTHYNKIPQSFQPVKLAPQYARPPSLRSPPFPLPRELSGEVLNVERPGKEARGQAKSGKKEESGNLDGGCSGGEGETE